MTWKSTETVCSLTIVGCWAFGMLAILMAYGWDFMDALFSVPTFTITAVCIFILGSKFILDHAANTSPVFQDEIDDLDGTDNSTVPAPRL